VLSIRRFRSPVTANSRQTKCDNYACGTRHVFISLRNRPNCDFDDVTLEENSE
jgi:hypothetical protein